MNRAGEQLRRSVNSISPGFPLRSNTEQYGAMYVCAVNKLASCNATPYPAPPAPRLARRHPLRYGTGNLGAQPTTHPSEDAEVSSPRNKVSLFPTPTRLWLGVLCDTHQNLLKQLTEEAILHPTLPYTPATHEGPRITNTLNAVSQWQSRQR
jgi:hypothetical protein